MFKKMNEWKRVNNVDKAVELIEGGTKNVEVYVAFTSPQLSIFGDVLIRNETLKGLRFLNSYYSNDVIDVKSFAAAMEENKSLESLEIHNCKIGSVGAQLI